MTRDDRARYSRGYDAGKGNQPFRPETSEAFRDGWRSGRSALAYERGRTAGLANDSDQPPPSEVEFAESWTRGFKFGWSDANPSKAYDPILSALDARDRAWNQMDHNKATE